MEKYLTNYYPLFYARSGGKNNFFSVSIRNFDVTTTNENLNLEFFEKSIESTIPKLFKDISLLKNN